MMFTNEQRVQMPRLLFNAPALMAVQPSRIFEDQHDPNKLLLSSKLMKVVNAHLVFLFLLDRSLVNLFIRQCIAQGLSLLKLPPSKIVRSLYYIAASNLLFAVLHCVMNLDSTPWYLDFLGVDSPSRPYLIFLDLVVCLLQMTLALVPFFKAETATNDFNVNYIITHLYDTFFEDDNRLPV